MSSKTTQKTKTKNEDVTTEDAQAAPVSNLDEEAIDDLLDEIDDVLETNAEEFVRDYVQKGGQ